MLSIIFILFLIMRRPVNRCRQRLKELLILQRILQTRTNYVWSIIYMSSFNKFCLG